MNGTFWAQLYHLFFVFLDVIFIYSYTLDKWYTHDRLSYIDAILSLSFSYAVGWLSTLNQFFS